MSLKDWTKFLQRVATQSKLVRERRATVPRIPELLKGLEQANRGRVPGPARLLILDLPRAECAAQGVEGQH